MDDLISRQAAVDALNYELDAIDHVPKWVFDRLTKCIERVPSAQPEPIKINIDHELTKDEYEKLRKDLADAPIVLQPERKTGKWKYGEDSCGQDGWTCSECGFFVPWYYGYNKNIDFIWKYKTCPCCDAKMLTYTGKDGGGA